MNETDNNKQTKPRPRPGTSNSSGNISSSLLAPPPPSNKKPSSYDSPDLISFASPPTSTDNIIELCNTQKYLLLLISIGDINKNI